MTEPNIVKSKKQRIEEETAGSYFGALPQRYGELLFLNFAPRCVKFYLNHIAIDPQCVKFNIIQTEVDPISRDQDPRSYKYTHTENAYGILLLFFSHMYIQYILIYHLCKICYYKIKIMRCVFSSTVSVLPPVV